MNQDSFRLFLHLAKSLHFATTSRECFVSPPTLTRAIQRLEDELGMTLFHRTNRSVQLTKAGELFQSYCEQQVNGLEQFKQDVSLLDGELTGTLRLYCSVTASHQLLTQCLSVLKEKAPRVKIILETGPSEYSVQKILDGSVDISLSSFPDTIPSNIHSCFLRTVPLQLVGPKGSSFNDIRSHALPFIFPKSVASFSTVSAWFDTHSIQPDPYDERLTFDGIIPLVSLGYGASVLPSLVLESHPLRPELEFLFLDRPVGDLSIGLMCKQNKRDLTLIKLFFDG